MERTTGRPDSPEEPAVWERPLPWLGETESRGLAEAEGESGAAAESAPDSAVEPESGNRPEPETASETASEPEAEPRSEDRPDARTDPEPETDSHPTPAGDSLTVPEPVPAPTPRPGDEDTPVPGTADAPSGRLFRLPVTRTQAPGGTAEARARRAEPERGARVVGAAIAGGALLVLGLGTAGFMAMPGDGDSGPRAATVGDGARPHLAEDGAVAPSPSRSASKSASADGRPAHHDKATPDHPAEDAPAGKGSSPKPAAGHRHEAADASATHTSKTAGASPHGSKPKPKPAAKPAGRATVVAGDAIVGYGSAKCVEVSAHAGKDGSPLRLWSCDGDAWQKWVFKSDGSVRSMGLCLDIANASQADGAAIQLARCNGGWAQRFRLNSAHDLVNTQIGKCVDAKDNGSGNGTRLQLWECSGTSNQKWHLG
ncbi:ricin-type beta-trefoil lectin domain protein [Streptomyces sp. LP11]|uniref:Ricin-type beta-trefoil lectin domain protein n=1 Tax=Streptomyces pyxinicus TaxID=2970331 RepID=A0ABT2B6M7_9ACTN|nr:ricin-type beta-trefoil lectin domain protein [Streptomyces sp. LP11]MCS0603750.1 ricin-type beta-trefoil lectin domain protein [Streptomyces sp. LP11]